MKHLYISLSLDLTRNSPAGAGWYVSATSDEGALIPLTSVPIHVAKQIGDVIQNGLQYAEGELPQVMVNQLVLDGTSRIKEALLEELEFAEAQAAKVPILRKKIGVGIGSDTPFEPKPPPQRKLEYENQS